MKIEIELTDEQLSLIINSLEVAFRPFMVGQMGCLAENLALCSTEYIRDDGSVDHDMFDRYIDKRECIKYALDAVQKMMYGEYNYKAELPKDVHRISDMWSALRHLQWERLPEKDSWDVRSSDPIRLSDWKMIKVKEVK